MSTGRYKTELIIRVKNMNKLPGMCACPATKAHAFSVKLKHASYTDLRNFHDTTLYKNECIQKDNNWKLGLYRIFYSYSIRSE